MPTIDWSDPTVQGAFIASMITIAGVILAALAGVGGVVLGAHIAAGAAEKAAKLAASEAQANRDDARQARELDRVDAQRARFADRKFTLAIDLLRAADVHWREAAQYVASRWEDFEQRMDFDTEREGPFPTIGTTEPVRAAFLALDLVAPAMAPTASELYEATVPIGSLAASWREPEGASADSKEWSRKWAVTNERWIDARLAFVDAVRADLGVNLDGQVSRS